MLEFYVLAGKHEFNVSVPLLTSCVCVCRLVSSDIKEQGEECQKSFGHDGAMRHAAIHFESARTLGDPAQPAGHSRYHTLAYAQTSTLHSASQTHRIQGPLYASSPSL